MTKAKNGRKELSDSNGSLLAEIFKRFCNIGSISIREEMDDAATIEMDVCGLRCFIESWGKECGGGSTCYAYIPMEGGNYLCISFFDEDGEFPNDTRESDKG